MKIVMTLLVRDEEDIIASHLRYHLAHGVDQILVTDNLSRDGTPSILEQFARGGRCVVRQETSDDYSQGRWVTRMARIACEELRADWVIHSDADEFWWSKQGDIRQVLADLAADIGVIEVPRFNFLARSDTGESFVERMVYREVSSRNAVGRPLPPKIAHRAHPEAVVAQGNHRVEAPGLGRRQQSEALCILHFPMRTRDQFTHKIALGGQAYARNTELPPDVGETWRRLYERYEAGGLDAYWDESVVSEGEIEQRLEEGTVVRDVRLRNALRELEGSLEGRSAVAPDMESAGHFGSREESPRPGSLSSGENWSSELGLAGRIDGWMPEPALEALMELAATVPAESDIVEIGSYRGRSTVALALGARRGGGARVFTCDPHHPAQGVRGGSFGPADRACLYRNLLDAGVTESVCCVALESTRVATTWPTDSVGLLLVDGSHEEVDVEADLSAWFPALRPDAVVVMDDVDYPGVARVVERWIGSGRLQALGQSGKLVWFRPVAEPDATGDGQFPHRISTQE